MKLMSDYKMTFLVGSKIICELISSLDDLEKTLEESIRKEREINFAKITTSQRLHKNEIPSFLGSKLIR